MPLRFLAALVACLLSFFLLPRDALAQAAPAIYVVEVSGDRLDPARVRAAVARELSVTAVAPDDPRAASATGTIEVTASAASSTLRVAFKKSRAPVVRSVALPEDPARAEVAAVFLAGNLARDEASELLGGLRKPAAAPDADPPTAPAPAAIPEAELLDREELRRLRLTLQSNIDATKRRTRAVMIGAAAFSAVTLPVGIALLADARSPSANGAGNFLFWMGTAGLGATLGTLLETSLHPRFGKTPDEQLRDKLNAIEVDGGPPADVLERIDDAWRAQAAEARSSRHHGAVFALVLGTLAMGGAAAIELGKSRDSDNHSFSSFLYVVGALDVGLGIYGLLVESPFEESYATWHAARRPAPASVRPSLGFAPLPGGGAFSAGFTF